MAERKKKTKEEVVASKVPLDWEARKGSTSAADDGIALGERIIFVRDDLMQFINAQNGRMATIVVGLEGKMLALSAHATAVAKEQRATQRAMQGDLDRLIADLNERTRRRESRWYRRAWAWIVELPTRMPF
jgi:hypothetical protein